MRAIFYSGEGKTEILELENDSQFVLDQPRGFVRIIEKKAGGIRNWYFNMQNLIALGPSEETL